MSKLENTRNYLACNWLTDVHQQKCSQNKASASVWIHNWKLLKTVVKQVVGWGFESILPIINKHIPRLPPFTHWNRLPGFLKCRISHKSVGLKDNWMYLYVYVFAWDDTYFCAPLLWFEPCWLSTNGLCESCISPHIAPQPWWDHWNQIKSGQM